MVDTVVDRPTLNRIWASSDSEVRTDPGDTKYQKGWEAEIPTYEVLNYLQWKLDTTLLALGERGFFEWGSDINYKLGALTWDETNGQVYISKVDNPDTSKPPSTNTEEWDASSVQISRVQFDEVSDLISDHINDIDNPHELGPHDVDTYSCEEIDGMVSQYNEVGQEHIEDMDNPHGTTAEQAGGVAISGGTYDGTVTMGSGVLELDSEGVGAIESGTTGVVLTINGNGLGVSSDGTASVVKDGEFTPVLSVAGGELVGVLKTNSEIQSTFQDNFRFVNDTYGSFWRQDANTLYLMLTNLNDAYGTYNDLRPFMVDLETGITSVNGYISYSPGNKPTAEDINAISRDTCDTAGFVATDVNNPYMRHTPTGDIVGIAPRDWVNATFIAATGLGAQYAATKNSGDAYADAGCVISGIGDFGADDGFGYQRPMQYCINGQWFTSMALGETPPQSMQLETSEEYPEVITELSNFKLYTPKVRDRDNTLYLVSDEGFDFYEASKYFASGTVVGYDTASGIIRLINEVSPHIWPINMSIAIVNDLPDGCSMDGTWTYSDGEIEQDGDLLLARNRQQLSKQLSKVNGLILMYQTCNDLSVSLEGDDEELERLKQYVSSLRNVDLTQSKPNWPQLY